MIRLLLMILSCGAIVLSSGCVPLVVGAAGGAYVAEHYDVSVSKKDKDESSEDKSSQEGSSDAQEGS